MYHLRPRSLSGLERSVQSCKAGVPSPSYIASDPMTDGRTWRVLPPAHRAACQLCHSICSRPNLASVQLQRTDVCIKVRYFSRVSSSFAGKKCLVKERGQRRRARLVKADGRKEGDSKHYKSVMQKSIFEHTRHQVDRLQQQKTNKSKKCRIKFSLSAYWYWALCSKQ